MDRSGPKLRFPCSFPEAACSLPFGTPCFDLFPQNKKAFLNWMTGSTAKAFHTNCPARGPCVASVLCSWRFPSVIEGHRSKLHERSL